MSEYEAALNTQSHNYVTPACYYDIDYVLTLESDDHINIDMLLNSDYR